jgi:hypothetical protein
MKIRLHGTEDECRVTGRHLRHLSKGNRPMARSVARQPGRERGPAPDLSLASLVVCRMTGCRHRECRRATAAHFRLVPPVPAAGTRRRLRALARVGWPAAAIAARLGMAVPAGIAERAVGRVQGGKIPELPSWLAAAVATLYDDVWDVYGGCEDAAAFAHRRGWAPPMAWDDNPGDPHYIDDPACPVSDWRPRRMLRPDPAGRVEDIREVRAEDIREVMAGGHGTRVLAAERLGLSRACVDKALSRAAARAS